MEEKDLQIAMFVNRMEAPYDENEKPLLDKAEEKLDQAIALMGSLSVQQLQEMITSTIKAQYQESSHDSVLYSKPYSKKIDG